MSSSSVRIEAGGDRLLQHMVPPPRDAGLRLVLLPYAGAGAYAYQAWAPRWADRYELLAVCLPGRDRLRTREPLVHMLDLVASLARELRSFPPMPTALFGHSMGALVAFELARALGPDGPSLLLVSACPPPAEAKRLIHEHGHRFAIDARLPLTTSDPRPVGPAESDQLRSDLRLLASYEYHAGPPLACAIVAFGGTSDAVSRVQLRAWCDLGSKPTALGGQVHMFPGGHFYCREGAEGRFLQTFDSILSAVDGRSRTLSEHG